VLTPSSPHVKRQAGNGKALIKVFWARPANAELDRSGDWLLKNLTTTRARSSRAGPA
jgi:hypothetical protein